MARASRAVRSLFGALRRSWVEAFGDDGSVDPLDRRWIALAASLTGLVVFLLAWQRYATFHNRNFDLAFYARLAWGDAHGQHWEPLLDAHVWGLHFVWVFEVLGRLGLLLGQVRTLLLAQSLALALAAWPMARIAARSLGGAPRHGASPSMRRLAPHVGALVWLLQPNLWHVATTDVHPGTLAVLPLAWACDALHRRSAHGLVWSSLGVLACREDLGLVLVCMGLAFAVRTRMRDPVSVRAGLTVAGGALVYVAVFLGVFHPRYAPANGSFEQHFARWGAGPLGAALGVLSDPLGLLGWLTRDERAPYLLVITAPLAFLSFLAPEWMLLAAPVLAMNLLSSFPTTLFLDSHYLTPALPMLVTAALVGAARLPSVLRLAGLHVEGRAVTIALLSTAAIAHVLAGGSPIARRYDGAAYVEDSSSGALREALALIPPDASVQAPERVLAHLAERRTLRRGPPPETRAEFVLFDAWRRRVDAHHESLLRTEEEPLLRDWLARDDHALLYARDGIYLLARDVPRARDLGVARYVSGVAGPDEGRALTHCLALIDAELEPTSAGAVLTLTLGVRERCPSDLALRIGWGYRPRRVDLITQGELSPARLLPGERLLSRHLLSPAEWNDAVAHGLRVGAVRQSGARPDPGDPVGLDIFPAP